MAGAFVAIITNSIVGARVGALEATLASQYNPVNVTAADQTNNAPLACVDPEAGQVAGASTGVGEGAVLGASTNGGYYGYGVAKAKYLPLFGNYSQSNTSTITTTTTNTFTDNRWSGNSWSYSDSSTSNSHNSNTQTWTWDNNNTNNSGNTTNTDNSNNSNQGNTTNTDNSNNSNQGNNNGNTNVEVL